MRALFWIASISMLSCWMSTQPALADRRDFDVINDTPWDIYYIYVRVSETFDWGDDVMDEDVLSPATAVHIHFSGGTACHHDIRIKYKNGIDIVWSDIDLCAVSKFRVWYDFAEKKYQAHWE